MTVEMQIYTDYVCPYCLLAESVIREEIKDKDVEIRWRAFELRPYPVETLRVEDPYLPTVWRNSVYPLAEQLGVPIALPGISPQPRTDKAFEVFAMAEEQGLGDAFSSRALRAFFQEERNIGETEVLVELAADVSLEREAVREALEQGTYTETHRKALKHAYEEARITGVPTLMVGDYRMTGMPDRRKLRTAIDEALGSNVAA